MSAKPPAGWTDEARESSMKSFFDMQYHVGGQSEQLCSARDPTAWAGRQLGAAGIRPASVLQTSLAVTDLWHTLVTLIRSGSALLTKLSGMPSDLPCYYSPIWQSPIC